VLWLVLIAEATLVLFGLLPRPWNAICFFLNGLPLGMVFGLIVGLLEGRRLTEAMTAGLCASFILADGVMKSVGGWLLASGVTEDWMPGVAGALFLLPLGGCVAMLIRIPPPSPPDIAARSERLTMNRDDRWSFLRRHAMGLAPLVVMYLLVTVVRSLRADFAPEIWRGLGVSGVPAVFTQSEILVMLGVLAVNGGAVLIRDNSRAFLVSLATCGLGFVLIAIALFGRGSQQIDGFWFMVLIGLGLYLPYVAMHTTVFERLLAVIRDRGNIGFLLYVADAIGYLGYVVVMIVRNFGKHADDWLGMLSGTCWLATGVSAVCLIICWRHFATHRQGFESAVANSQKVTEGLER
ncbi:MAG: DUF5690 family protein, partial [Planctomycetota bacterium]|nr:DUF5690 family protein [Planctomycetota bacterium]